jgi:hypothetical protein
MTAATTGFGGEDISMFGMQFVDNGKYGVYAPNQPANEFNCFFVRSATTEMPTCTHERQRGGHMERCFAAEVVAGPFNVGARGLEDDLRAERERSGYVNAVVLRLAEDRKKVCHLQHVAELFPKVKQFELASRLLGS